MMNQEEMVVDSVEKSRSSFISLVQSADNSDSAEQVLDRNLLERSMAEPARSESKKVS